MTRLIDGELSDLERFDFLSTLDEGGSEGWRNLALGFLERHLVTDALKQLEAQAEKEKAESPRQRKASRWAAWGGPWVAGAALLLLGLVLGFSGTRLIGGSGSEMASADSSVVAPDDEITDPEMVRLASSDEGLDVPMRGGYITANFRDGSQLIVPVSHIAVQNQ